MRLISAGLEIRKRKKSFQIEDKEAWLHCDYSNIGHTSTQLLFIIVHHEHKPIYGLLSQ